jgi:2-polyprenyl-3-methyl-5-hydroxy-6-metoxy-1,4-benzoquinol methylase
MTMSELEAPVYWDGRAQAFARAGAGLAAVCSYGMPLFYNRAIDLCQRLALERWLDVRPGTAVLDVGCGIGRWSRELARRGARVTGVDLSPTMVDEARRRADEQGVGRRCRFHVADLTRLDLHERFPLVLGVTVLQHILDADAFQAAVRRLAMHLLPGGRLVLLEAAPSRRVTRCDTRVFQARDAGAYLAAFEEAGLSVTAVTGVDPAPFKTLLLPHYGRLPAPLALLALAAVTAISLPIDLLLGRLLVRASWHKVFVLEAPPDAPA